MGQTFSCLKPEAHEFKVPPEPHASVEANQLARKGDEHVQVTASESVGNPVITAGTAAADVVAAVEASDSTEVSSSQYVPQPAYDPHPAKSAPADSMLDSSQLGTALTGTTNLQSTFTASSGYPYNSWELGPPSTDNEPARVQALRALDILDTMTAGRRARLDEEADMVLGALMQMFRARTAMLAFFDDSRIVLRNSKGIMQPGEFPYRWSFCAYTLTKQRPQTLVVPDATKDMRFADNPFVVGGPRIRFYCGAPLVSSTGHILGTLCFADDAPRPDFDAAQCFLLNNMAELMVRQVERFKAHAGPAGPVDAVTTALTRVARTIECYEAVTGLVDISVAGWMMMYVNEAWETLCAPWTRKQLVGRPLQALLALEPDPYPEAATEQEQQQQQQQQGEEATADSGTSAATSGAAAAAQRGVPLAGSRSAAAAAALEGSFTVAAPRTTGGSSSGMGYERCIVIGGNGPVTPAPGPDAEGGGSVLQAMSPSERRLWRQRREGQTSGRRDEGPGAVRPWSPREIWQRYAATLRAGQEVVVEQARLMMEDGRPSTSVVRVVIRPANYHVLDAATRMPVGVPPQTALPSSITTAATDSSMPPAGSSVNSATAAAPETAASAGSVAAPDPFYCFVAIIREDENGAAANDPYAVSEVQPSRGGLSQAGVAAAVASPAVLGGGGCWAGGGVDSQRNSCAALAGPATPSASTCLHGPHPGAYDLSARPSTRPSAGRPSLDAGTAGHSGRGGGGRVYGPDSLAASAALAGAVAASGSTRGRIMTGMSDTQSTASWTYGMEPFPGLRLGHLLGKGGYGRVFSAYYRGRKVAAKVISNAMLKSATCVNGVTLEALLAQEIEHPYIVRTYKCVVRSYGGVAGAIGGGGRGPSLAELGTRRSSLAPPMTSAASTAFRGHSATTLSAGPSAALIPSAVPSTAGGPAVGANLPSPSPPSCPTANGGGGSTPATAAAATAKAAEPAGPVGAPSGAVAAAAPAPPAVARCVAAETSVEGEDYDSFDVVGAEQSGAMIDQLVSGGGRGNAPAAMTATADAEQIAAALVTPGLPPRLPNAGSADPSMVFGADAAAAAVAAAAAAAASSEVMSYRPGDTLPDGETWILQEYCTGGTLQDAIETGRLRTEPSRLRGEPNMPVILLTAQEIASAMQCLHSRGYLHGDLSAVNVLLTEAAPAAGGEGAAAALSGCPEGGAPARGWVAKVSDFGLAKHLPDPKKPYVSSAYGVITHCAPEVLKSHAQTQKADVYSFGVLLWQMWTGSRPWAGMNRFQILGTVTNAHSSGLRFMPDAEPPAGYLDLTRRCLSFDPAARPTFAEVCEDLRLMTYQAAAVGMLKA